MGLRGLVAIVALLATGIVGGYAAAAYLTPQPLGTGTPEPITATSPRVSGAPLTPLQEDPTEPALPTDLEMVDVMVGSGKNAFVFPAPVGWSRIEPSSNEVKYKVPSNPDNTYVLRVEQVKSQHETIPDIVQATLLDLEREFDDVELTRRTYDSLEFDYLYNGYRRYGFLTWLDISRSGQAEAEIAVTGREKDVPGMRELVNRVIRGIRAG